MYVHIKYQSDSILSSFWKGQIYMKMLHALINVFQGINRNKSTYCRYITK